MDVMTKEESYAQRRQLFKNIWETAMQIDEKDVDNIMAKPKVIKTLRLDEVDRCVIGKKKKERIRNLRTVCKKILDFCDRQDADDLYYEQKAEGKEIAEGEEPLQQKMHNKVKTRHKRKKVTRTKSLFASSPHRVTMSEKKEDHPRILADTSRNISHIKKKTTFNFVKRTSDTHRRATKSKSNPDAEGRNLATKGIARRKVIRKKRSKRKKSAAQTPPGPSGIDWPDL